MIFDGVTFKELEGLCVGILKFFPCLKYTKYADVKVKSSSGSPFKAHENNTVQDILDRIKKFMPQDMVQFEGSPFIDRNLFYKFNIAYWRKLFQVADYPSRYGASLGESKNL